MYLEIIWHHVQMGNIFEVYIFETFYTEHRVSILKACKLCMSFLSKLSSIIMIVFIFIFIFRMDKISCLCVFKVLMLVINCQLICQVKLIHLCHIHVFYVKLPDKIQFDLFLSIFCIGNQKFFLGEEGGFQVKSQFAWGMGGLRHNFNFLGVGGGGLERTWTPLLSRSTHRLQFLHIIVFVM